ncbi:MAG: hypothetical protein IPJ02_14575 [Chitinophagaceae bacterium]|nr:hypothetical protein [Chitinophagaceae bacterium]
MLQKTVEINNASGIVKTFQKSWAALLVKQLFVSDGQADNANSLVNYKEDRPFTGLK